MKRRVHLHVHRYELYLGLPVSHPRFLFYCTGSGRVLGGTQDTLHLLSDGGDADLDDRMVLLEDLVDATDMGALQAAAEAAFRKGSEQLMKFAQVWWVVPMCKCKCK
jgi:hypothetical protein